MEIAVGKSTTTKSPSLQQRRRQFLLRAEIEADHATRQRRQRLPLDFGGHPVLCNVVYKAVKGIKKKKKKWKLQQLLNEWKR